MAVSGQAVTQAMQPTHLSSRNSGMRGASRLKSRVAAVPGGMIERARPASAGQLEVGDAAAVGGHDGPPELLDVGVHVEDGQGGPEPRSRGAPSARRRP